MGLKKQFEFTDLYSFDPETANEFGIPVENVKGMILLFPLPETETKNETKAEANFSESSPPLVFLKQTIENSCCLMALLHILLNNPSELLDIDLTPSAIKSLLNSHNISVELIEESVELKGIHEEMAQSGNTDVPELTDSVPFHFVALIPSSPSPSSGLFLMDGRRSGPIEFKSKEMSFFENACRVAREEFVEKSSDQTNFAAVILI